MGTNYYTVNPKTWPETYPGLHWSPRDWEWDEAEEFKEIHIGKASMGWRFLFHEQKGFWYDFPTFCAWVDKNVVNGDWIILNECSEPQDPKEFIDYIQRKQSEPRPTLADDSELSRYGQVNRGGYRFYDGEFS